MGAELMPLAKLAKWAIEGTCIQLYTDSQATMDAWNRLRANSYTDRALWKHPERNALRSIRASLALKPGLAHTITLHKVTSHTGNLGNEKADLLATLGSEGRCAAHVRVRESAAYVLSGEGSSILLGDVRKFAKRKCQHEHLEKWAASQGPQGLSAQIITTTNTNRKSGALRQILSSKKYTRETNSIILQQHKWTYGLNSDYAPPQEYACPLCGAQYGSAAHRLHECMGRVSEVLLAKLKHKWTGGDTYTSSFLSKWVEDIVDDEDGECRLVCNTWVPVNTLVALTQHLKGTLDANKRTLIHERNTVPSPAARDACHPHSTRGPQHRKTPSQVKPRQHCADGDVRSYQHSSPEPLSS